MNFWLTLALFGLLVVVTHFIEGVTGFGSTVLSMPFATMLLGVEVAKPVLTLYALLTCLYILFFEYQAIDWRNYIKMMAVLLPGLPVGVIIYTYLPKKQLMILLSLFMIVIAVRGLLLELNPAARRIGDGAALFMVFAGGVVHGAYASGGPLVIVYATEKITDKSKFRATLCLVWVTLNSLLLIQMLFAGQLIKAVWDYSLYGMVFLIGGTLFGFWAHRYIKGDTFKRITYGLLFVMGILTLIINWR